MAFLSLSTARCVRCLATDARFRTGHVTVTTGDKDGEPQDYTILASWCRPCWERYCRSPICGDNPGFSGEWRPDMGIRVWAMDDNGDEVEIDGADARYLDGTPYPPQEHAATEV